MATNRAASAQSALDDHAVAATLKRHVLAIADTPRNVWHYESLQRAAAYIDAEFTRAGYPLGTRSLRSRGDASQTSKQSDKPIADPIASS